jgi:hypothetical protein
VGNVVAAPLMGLESKEPVNGSMPALERKERSIDLPHVDDTKRANVVAFQKKCVRGTVN